MIGNRIRFALDILEKSIGPTEYVLRSGIPIDRPAIADFSKIIETSVFEQNRHIARFIEAVCFGNMLVLASIFGPLRHFILAHPKLLILCWGF
jgi:hypothetical protein